MYCRFREPSWLLFRSPGGIDPRSWLPVKSLKEPKCVWREVTSCIGARQLDKANYRSDTYRTVSEDNCEITSGIEPVKLLYDRFLQHGICTGHGRFNVLQRSSRNHFVGTEQIENWSTHTNIGRPWDLRKQMICHRSDHWTTCFCKIIRLDAV